MNIIINRKLKSLDNESGKIIRNAIENIITVHEKNKNAYFFRSYGSGRGDFENVLRFSPNEKKYDIRQTRSSSAKNVYFATHIYVDEVKKDIRVLKNIL